MVDRPGDALVLFGLTGDLGEKKLFPSLYELAAAGQLDMPVVGVGSKSRSQAELAGMLRDAVQNPDPEVLDRIDLRYLAGDARESQVYHDLAEQLAGSDCPVVYAALPPSLFGSVAAHLAASPLSDRTRLVVEKPFGRDRVSAEQLYRDITGALSPDRLFIVDHFLAKSSVENLLVFRTANPLVDAMARGGTVDRVELTMAEDFGVDGRGSFYEGVGAVRDVLQNHLLQTVAVLAMEPPADASAEAFDRERDTLLGEIEPLRPTDVVFGQFEGYREVARVAADSRVETFFAVRLTIANERWAGVPFLIRSGKRMPTTRTEAVLVSSRHCAWRPEPVVNRLRFVLKPEVSIRLDLVGLDPSHHGLQATTLRVPGPEGHGPLGDYATMLAGALAGDRRHFATIDGLVAAWRVVDPILDAGIEVHPYPPGTDGPPAATALWSAAAPA